MMDPAKKQLNRSRVGGGELSWLYGKFPRFLKLVPDGKPSRVNIMFTWGVMCKLFRVILNIMATLWIDYFFRPLVLINLYI